MLVGTVRARGDIRRVLLETSATNQTNAYLRRTLDSVRERYPHPWGPGDGPKEAPSEYPREHPAIRRNIPCHCLANRVHSVPTKARSELPSNPPFCPSALGLRGLMN